jgi:autotransporter-associated beta strand protein
MTVIGVGGGGGNATLIAHGGVNGGAGAGIVIEDKAADGGMARVQLDGNAYFDISIRIRPAVNIGSVEGHGNIYLGANTLAIGTNNLSTEFSGVIQDGNRHNRTGGAITKLGTGTLTITGANTYTGGTTVTAGALRVSNTKGSGAGTGSVQVNSGILAGNGIISGAVTIGTGSGTKAKLQPGFESSTANTLTLQDSLTFRSEGDYSYKLYTNKAKADEVIANGVTIEKGAHFDFEVMGSTKLGSGTGFTAISNTAATPIGGNFENLRDGSLITSGPNSFQVSYTGGDGNDLTLTVVP